MITQQDIDAAWTAATQNSDPEGYDVKGMMQRSHQAETVEDLEESVKEICGALNKTFQDRFGIEDYDGVREYSFAVVNNQFKCTIQTTEFHRAVAAVGLVEAMVAFAASEWAVGFTIGVMAARAEMAREMGVPAETV